MPEKYDLNQLGLSPEQIESKRLATTWLNDGLEVALLHAPESEQDRLLDMLRGISNSIDQSEEQMNAVADLQRLRLAFNESSEQAHTGSRLEILDFQLATLAIAQKIR